MIEKKFYIDSDLTIWGPTKFDGEYTTIGEYHTYKTNRTVGTSPNKSWIAITDPKLIKRINKYIRDKSKSTLFSRHGAYTGKYRGITS